MFHERDRVRVCFKGKCSEYYSSIRKKFISNLDGILQNDFHYYFF